MLAVCNVAANVPLCHQITYQIKAGQHGSFVVTLLCWHAYMDGNKRRSEPPSDVWLHALQADKLAHGEGRIQRTLGATAGFVLNRLPATIEAVLSRDATFPGVPYMNASNGPTTTGEQCAADFGSVPLLAASGSA